jgi:hypothetical protein
MQEVRKLGRRDVRRQVNEGRLVITRSLLKLLH